MSLTPGSRLGAYAIEAAIGAGGMGEVYRARDTRLHRHVALKVLPEMFAADADRLARFEREARALASLNHPNIGVIYGFEESSVTAGLPARALVLEFIDGPTLADRIATGPMSRGEVLMISRQIADALQAAHDHGVIHRDLKPANIKVRPDGTVKVLDFGLAKMLDTAPALPDLTRSPTQLVSSPGVVLGTAAYMSPEQAKGQDVDRRADVWAFGCVLFEMLSGRVVFDGHTAAEVIAGVLKSDPDWRKLPDDTPEALRRLLRRCLERDPARRLRDIGDARLELDEVPEVSRVSGSSSASFRTERWVWLAAVVGLALALVIAAPWRARDVPAPAEVVVETDAPVTDPEDLVAMAVSHDGRSLAFVSTFEGQPHIWVRTLDRAESRPLPGTAGAALPFWSPDGRSIAFFVDGLLKRIDLDGGLVRRLAAATAGVGGTWNREGLILFAPIPAGPLSRLSAEGGTPVDATRLGSGHVSHTAPHFLPDGRHFLFLVRGTPEARGIHLGDIDSGVTRRLFEADSGAVFASGHLLFGRQATLYAQRFDPERQALEGDPFPVAEQLTRSIGRTEGIAVSASAGGALAFRVGTARSDRQFAWVDRSGGRHQTVGEPDRDSPMAPSASPDMSSVAFHRRSAGNADIWVLDTRRGSLDRLTTHTAEDAFPVWSHDGARIAFMSTREGGSGIYEKQMTAAGQEELLIPSQSAEVMPVDWSRDGQFLIYRKRTTATGMDLLALRLNEKRESIPIVATEFEETGGQLSPDGKWIAYQSNSSGRFEVYVQAFPTQGSRHPVSTAGGAQARWRRDGRELFYIALDGWLMAVPIRASTDGSSIDIGQASRLFGSRVGRVLSPSPGPQYVVSDDGQRFLINEVVERAATPKIRMIVNWRPSSVSSGAP